MRVKRVIMYNVLFCLLEQKCPLQSIWVFLLKNYFLCYANGGPQNELFGDTSNGNVRVDYCYLLVDGDNPLLIIIHEIYN